MPIFGGGIDNDSSEDIGVDANASSVSSSVEIGAVGKLGVYVVANTGNSSSHVVTVQISPNGTDWFDTEHTITGVGNLHELTCTATLARCAITTTQGEASTIDIYMVSK